MARQREIVASPAYKEGDPEAVAARYRLHFKPALARPEDYEKLMARMKAAFIRQGKDGILKARAVEDQLMRDTWQVNGYDLLPRLRSLRIPTLVLYRRPRLHPRRNLGSYRGGPSECSAGHPKELRTFRVSGMRG